MNSCNAEHQQLVDDCEAREARLSDWERGFVDSVKAKLATGASLTKGQAEKLDEVWERVTAKG